MTREHSIFEGSSFGVVITNFAGYDLPVLHCFKHNVTVALFEGTADEAEGLIWSAPHLKGGDGKSLCDRFDVVVLSAHPR